jgi:hypothetical protein
VSEEKEEKGRGRTWFCSHRVPLVRGAGTTELESHPSVNEEDEEQKGKG